MERKSPSGQTASHEDQAIPAKGLNLPTDEVGEADGTVAYEQRLRPLWATFRNILLVVFLIFVCAVVQMFMLWRACNRGMKTATTLEQEGLPTLNSLALIQEHLALYRLNAYEHLFAQQGEKAGRAKAVEDTAAQTRAELANIKSLLPEAEGQRLASELEKAFADLDTEFRQVRNLVDADFAAAMKLMDENIPPLTERVTAAANAFSDFGYHLSGGQATATFDSFGWIKSNAVLFGAANMAVVLGAVLFVLLAARRSRTQLSITMARVEARTKELAQSVSLLNATLESTGDGILVMNAQGKMTSCNAKFAQLWRLPPGIIASGSDDEMLKCVVGQLKDEEAFIRRVREFYANPDLEGLDILEFKDGRVFERYSQPQRLDGATAGRVWCFRDVTERVRAKDELQQEHNLLRTLIDHIPDFIYVRDLSNRFVVANESFARLMGVAGPSALIGKRDADFYPPEMTSTYGAVDQEVFAGRGLFNRERLIHFPNGQELATLTTKVPFKNNQGEVIGLIGIGRDVTERKRVEAELDYERGLLRLMLENLPDLIYFKDAQSRFMKASQALAAKFGLASPDDLVGKSDFDFFTEEHARPALEDEQEILTTGRPLIGRVEKEITKDGRVSWALTNKMPLRNKDGQIIGTFGITKDITDLKQAQEAAAYERDLLRTLLDNSPDSIYFKDLQSRLMKVSRSEAANLFRIALSRHHAAHPGESTDKLPAQLTSLERFHEYVIGKTDADTYGGECAGGFDQDEQEIIRSGRPMIGKIEETVCPDGSSIWHMTTKVPWRNKEGEIIGTFGTSRDISDLKNAEAKVEEVHKQLVETSRLAGMAEVATNVLHNVGNVLNSVNISTGLLAESVKQSKAASLARVVALLQEHNHDLGEFVTRDANGKHVPAFLAGLAEHFIASQENMAGELDALQRHIEHIKAIVATQQHYAKVGGVKETINLVHLVEDSLRINEQAMNRHHVEVVREFETVPLLDVEKHKILQILVNLLRNAKHACQDSRRTDPRLTVRVANGAGRVRISVQDNGVGIAPENLTRVFNHGFTTRKDGHGFGLHSGALAAKEMGGSLTVHSDGPGQGATFTLELPCSTREDSHD